MPLAAGQTLTHYEILGRLGAGGMGEVYRARDMRLEREVAIKVLPEHFAHDEERLRRFEREAKALASLNHPNVAQVFGIDQVADTCFLAMELVPGEDLAARLARGPLPVDEALDVCRQIAEGLEAAHEAGVIHRDLKPANVRITPDGKVKVLDFGLAKPVGNGTRGGSTSDTALTTEAGRLLGTPTYMAPEQARGRPIDKRVDVWAIGCVLYECLTGRRAFEGDTLGDVLAGILEREPDWSALPNPLSPRVRDLLERTLDKDPRQRLRDIGEARILLGRGAEEAPELRPGPRRVSTAVAVVIVAAGIGMLAARALLPAPSGAVERAIQLRRLTERAGMEVTPAVSPDEKTLAFIALQNGRRHVFVRRMSGGTPTPITVGEFDHSFPRWVDEDTILYFRHPEEGESQGSLWLTRILSANPPEFVARVDGEADVNSAGQIVTLRPEADGAPSLLVMDLKGRTLETLPLLDGSKSTSRFLQRTYSHYSSPRWSPDDRFVAVESQLDLSNSGIHVVSVQRADPPLYYPILGRTRGLDWLSDGSGLVYASSSGSTMVYPPTFVLRVLRLADGSDEPIPTTDSGYVSYVEPEVTSLGNLVASRIQMESDIYRFPVGEDTAKEDPAETVRNAERITYQTGMVQVPSASWSGEEVAYLWDSGGHANIWIADIHGSTPRQITDVQDPQVTVAIPNWSPRGDRIVYFRHSPDRKAEQWLVHLDEADRVNDGSVCLTSGGAVWARDGEWIYHGDASGFEPGSTTIGTEKVEVETGDTVHVRDDAANMLINSDETVCYFYLPGFGNEGDVYKASPPDIGERELLIGGLQSRIPLWPHHFTLSPDDRWLATPLKDQDTTNLYVVSTETGELVQVTDFGDRATMIARQVSWSGDSRWIYAAVMDTDADIVVLDGALW